MEVKSGEPMDVGERLCIGEVHSHSEECGCKEQGTTHAILYRQDEEYRGYEISETEWLIPQTYEGGDPMKDMPRKFVKAYPIDAPPEGSIRGGYYVPFLIERAAFSDAEVIDLRKHAKLMVDKIMDHPEVRNLTVDEWDKFLGYAEG